MAFHRLQDGATLARLDPYAEGEQVWLLHSGRDIPVTAEEVRDISKQVHGLDLPATRPEGGSCNCGSRFDAIEARLAALEAAPDHEAELFEEPAPDPRDAELSALRARIAELESASYIDRDERPDAVEAEPEIEPTRKMIPEQIGALMQEGETFEEARDRLTPELNRELAKLKNARGLAGEDLEREAEIETLLGMLSRLGEG